MKRIFTYCLLLFSITLAFAQPVGWDFGISSNSKLVIIQSKNFIKINDVANNVQKGDYVGIFSLVNGIEKCVGNTIIANDSVTSFQFNIYGKGYFDSTGYTNNTEYKIRWYRNSTKCQFSMTNSDSSSRLDTNRNQLVVSSAIGTYPTVIYNGRNFTIGDPNPKPSYNPIIPDLVFSSPKGLIIESSTGIIDLTTSLLGIYVIQLSSQYCIQQDTFNIRISEKQVLPPDISKLTYHILSPGCKTLGSIFFKSDSIIGQKPFTFKLNNISTNEPEDNSSGQFDNLREGIYQLTVFDSLGGESKYLKNISLLKAEDCSNTILAPNAKDGLQAIFIPETGNAKIMDREGNTIKQLSIPAEWDGRDAKGEHVPMGDYYLFINDQQAKTITVIR